MWFKERYAPTRAFCKHARHSRTKILNFPLVTMNKDLIFHRVMGLMNLKSSEYLLRCYTANRLYYCGDLKDTEQ